MTLYTSTTSSQIVTFEGDDAKDVPAKRQPSKPSSVGTGIQDFSGSTGDVRSDSGSFPLAIASGSFPLAIAANWSSLLEAEISKAQFARLVRLGSVPDGWRGAGSQSLRAKSVLDFLKFWSLIKDHALEPELALAPDGTLHAEWFKSPKQRLDARFVDNKIVFGLFSSGTILEGAEDPGTVAFLLLQHPSKPLLWKAP